jgi:preprotein translocase subunit SecG
MERIILIFHVLTALAIIGLIMLQQGKGAESGASFGGGASQTVFGSSGSWNFFSKMTAILATIFFTTSFTLAVVAKNSSRGVAELVPEMVVEEVIDIDEVGDIPQIEASDSSGSSEEIPEI